MDKRLSLLNDDEIFKLLEDDENFDYDTDGEDFDDDEIDDFNEAVGDYFYSRNDEIAADQQQSISTKPPNSIDISGDTAGFCKQFCTIICVIFSFYFKFQMT